MSAQVTIRLSIDGVDVRGNAMGDNVATFREACEHLLPVAYRIVECKRTNA